MSMRSRLGPGGSISHGGKKRPPNVGDHGAESRAHRNGRVSSRGGSPFLPFEKLRAFQNDLDWAKEHGQTRDHEPGRCHSHPAWP